MWMVFSFTSEPDRLSCHQRLFALLSKFGLATTSSTQTISEAAAQSDERDADPIALKCPCSVDFIEFFTTCASKNLGKSTASLPYLVAGVTGSAAVRD
eukprot:4222376-Amphidinium_carterae.1